MEERLQKVLAHAGVGSRRECERLIEQGNVTVNGKLVTDLGTKVDPEESSIKVHGKLLHDGATNTLLQYLILYKPKGVLTAMKNDPEGRPTLLALLNKHRIKVRVYPVGRLDYNSEGLVLLTNDGELAYRLTHPKYKVPKTYQVKVHGTPTPKIIRILSQGVNLEDGRTKPAQVKFIRSTGKNTWLAITIHEGKKRQIRRMCEKVRLPISKLKRTMIGPISLSGLKTGQFRYLSMEEVQKLKHAVKL
jgi:pseudouridine synthase